MTPTTPEESPAPLTPTTPEERVLMRAYCEAATKAPWKHMVDTSWPKPDRVIMQERGYVVIRDVNCDRFGGRDGQDKKDFDFIAKARIDFPRVLADLERALERIEKAPHAITCEANYQGRFPCNCWKSEARGR